ncbi:hypothetical protein ACFOYU_00860 [Microvirga sp. GCM10011540]|uniref:hypothetical protein n=1 Tax=Microvirga sp. GCM10011540 TaxID=3317338 RepID=UPI003618B8C6
MTEFHSNSLPSAANTVQILNFDGIVSTEAGPVLLDSDAEISGASDETVFLSLTVSLTDFVGTASYDFLSIAAENGLALTPGDESTEILYNGTAIAQFDLPEQGVLTISFDGYPATMEAVQAVLRALSYANTSSATPKTEERSIKVELTYREANTTTAATVQTKVLVRPDNAIVLTADMTDVSGTSGDDIFVLSSSTTLQGATLSGGSGNDALHLVGGGSLDLSNFSKIQGVEALRGSAEKDSFSLQSKHLLGLSEIDGGLGDGTEATLDTLFLNGNYFDFRGKTLAGLDSISLMGGTSPIFVFDQNNISAVFDTSNENCLIQLGTNGSNATFRLAEATLTRRRRTC